MRKLLSLLVLFIFTLPLAAQSVVDTLGGTSSAPTRTGYAKANLFRVDTTVVLLNHEWYLGITGPETLTFFRYRHHSQDGTYRLDWQKKVQVKGTGKAWYSPGPQPIELIAGNHYMLGVSWVGSVTYHYKTASSGQKVSFGAYHRAVTPTGVPPTWVIKGTDIAQYYQRLTTIPTKQVSTFGVPCGSATSPRLVAANLPRIGQSFTLDLVEAQASTPAAFFLTFTKPLGSPIPIAGCQWWLNPLGGPLLFFPGQTTSVGEAQLNLPIPNDPWLRGLMLSWQSALLSSRILFTNGVQATL